MKKILYTIIFSVFLNVTINAQGAPENIDYGIFAPGTHDGTPPANATFEFAIKPNISFPMTPQAGSFLLFLKLPTPLFTGTEVFTITENHLNANVSWVSPGYSHTDNYTYFFFNYEGTAFPLNAYTINTWAHILTIYATNLGPGVNPSDFAIADATAGLFTNPIDPENPTRTAINVLNFNELMPISIMPALPLELISFTAEKYNERSSRLEWVTVNEINTSHFLVQRSTDNKNWGTIGSVQAAGNSAFVQNYSFVDENVYNGKDVSLKAYYRLLMFDLDGRMENSPIASVTFGTDAYKGREFLVYPNPASDGIQVEWDASQVDQPTAIEIYDIAGKLIYQTKVADQTNQYYIDFGPTNIQTGLHLMRIMHGDVAIEHKQIVVSRN